MIRRQFLGAALGLLLLAPVPPSAAQDVQRIAAIVNDEIVSGYDVEQRMDLVIASAQLPDNAETRRRLRRQVLRGLVDERLQLQEARRFSVKVSEQDLDRAFGIIAAQNKVSPSRLDEFLRANRLSKEALGAQLSAEIAWTKLVRRRLGANVAIGEDEIDEAISRLKANVGRAENQLSEIYLPVDTPDHDDDVRRAAERLMEQLRAGASFQALARQFSRGATAQQGGAIGWVQPGQLSAELDRAVRAMEIDGLSGLVRARGGYYILHLNDRRRIMTADPLQTKVALKQIMLPIAQGASPAELQVEMGLAKNVAETVAGCGEVERVAQELKLNAVADLGTLELKDLPARIRKSIQDLNIGKFSDPIKTPNGLMLLMVCDREEPKTTLPDRDTIANNLAQQRITMLAQRYLRDLRRAAVVELR